MKEVSIKDAQSFVKKTIIWAKESGKSKQEW
jgi:hypothetical protein